jgi:hypothetical protein
LDYPWLDGKTHSLEVRNKPAAYILEVVEEELVKELMLKITYFS